MIGAALAAIGRSRTAILSVAVTYAIAILFGLAMVSSGNTFALERRDEIVGAAQSSGSLVALRDGEPVRAALLDFASNLVLGGLTSTILGISVVGLYPIVAYRGWVGGIVSVDSRHQSRLGDPAEAGYYLLTLLLQLIPYSIAGGVGVHLGVDAWRAVRRPRPDTWLGLPNDRLRDAATAYVLDYATISGSSSMGVPRRVSRAGWQEGLRTGPQESPVPAFPGRTALPAGRPGPHRQHRQG